AQLVLPLPLPLSRPRPRSRPRPPSPAPKPLPRSMFRVRSSMFKVRPPVPRPRPSTPCRVEVRRRRIDLRPFPPVPGTSTSASPAPHTRVAREQKITEFLHQKLPSLFAGRLWTLDSGLGTPIPTLDFRRKTQDSRFALGFDIAASGTGDLACIYIDSVSASAS